jgi:DNA-binding NarL/FixJ family response regulator
MVTIHYQRIPLLSTSDPAVVDLATFRLCDRVIHLGNCRHLRCCSSYPALLYRDRYPLLEPAPRGIPLSSASPIRILCVEDHPVFREGLATVIASQPDMQLIGFAGNGVEAVAEFSRHQPDVTLMDLQLPGSNGTDVLIAIRGEFPRARIVMLTTSDADGEIQRAMRAGAAAYLLKSMAKDDLLAVIRSVHAGRRHVPAEVAARLAEHLGEDDLTARELEVLSLIRDGYRNKQIADQLAIAETTVNFHVKNLVAKLQAKDRTHAVTIALRRGLLQM